MLELFEPNKEELFVMIEKLKIMMEDADSQAEWEELAYQLEILETKLKKIEDNDTYEHNASK